MVKNAIKVFARLKPEKHKKNIVNYQVHYRPNENLEEDLLSLVTPTQKTKEYPDNRAESWNFSFYRIFEESATQEDVFKKVAQPVVESALDGYNGTIFAYGQTASGKTYSITGRKESVEHLGILPRCLLYLFEMIQKRPENVYSVEVAYLEIYNENGYDLLDRKQQREQPVTRLEDLPRITVQEDEIGQLHLKNLTFHCVGSVEDAFELLLVGDSNRVTVETPMNPESSRSHCVFTIVVCTKEFGADEYKRAKVHLVDLAGSERVYKCSISGTILTEAKHINLSLHYLEQVIVCLGQESAGHIPYRNSLLTSILRDSLGGNCLTTMLATVSVAAHNLEETISTCRFAQRVALIRNDVRLVLESDVHSENALLKLENEKLRQQLKELTKETKMEELTAEDKRILDSQIRNFLESDGHLKVDNNVKKIEYCFESFKRVFELNKDPNSCLKKLEYYKDLVIQRDKEISLLFDLIKKERQKGKEGSSEKNSGDDLKAIENSSTLDSNFEKIKLSVECNGHEDHSSEVSSETDGKISSTISNILNNCVVLKKQKPKAKTTKSLFQRNSRSNFDQNIDTEIVTPKTADQIDSIDQFSTTGSISNDVSRPNLLTCNVINLTLNNSTETDEPSQQSLRKKERKKTKYREIEAPKKKTIEIKPDTELSTVRTETEKIEMPVLDTKDCTPFYERFLRFNVPKDSSDSAIENSTDKKTMNQTTEIQTRTTVDSTDQCKVSRMNYKRDTSYKPTIDTKLYLESVVPQIKEVGSRKREQIDTDRVAYTKSIGANLRDIDVGSNPHRNAESLENEAKESCEHSARSNMCSPDKIDSNRSKTSEKRTSITSFAVDYREKSRFFGERTKMMKEQVNETTNYDENKHSNDSLPLTGDPEIDEEIIAFYRAKRTGGTY